MSCKLRFFVAGPDLASVQYWASGIGLTEPTEAGLWTRVIHSSCPLDPGLYNGLLLGPGFKQKLVSGIRLQIVDGLWD